MDIGGSEGVSVYAEAKGEYTKQLCQYMIPALQRYFLDLLEEAKLKEADSRKVLVSFQTLLEGIADWNMDKVQRETGSLAESTQCDYLEELLTAVFIAHTKVLSAIRLTTKQKKLQITIPKLDHFLHRTLTECARLLWSNTYLFSPSSPALERQKNLRQIETFLTDGVLQAIRSMLPVKNILREYLKEDSSDDEEDGAPAAATPKQTAPEQATSTPVTQASSGPDAIGGEDVTSPSQDGAGAIVVQTADLVEPPPAAPVFTGMDTQFQEDAVSVTLGVEEEAEAEDGAEEDGGGDAFDSADEEDNDIKILDEPPVGLDDFEDLERSAAAPAATAAPAADEPLPMEFELLE
jgi:hypothetical protein